MRVLVLFAIGLTSFSCFSQERDAFMVSTGFMIILSTKDYSEAFKKAEEASALLKLELKLNGNFPGKKGGLDNDEVCECGIQHGYIARGRYDAGMYVSIEHTNSYEQFTDGYYIVVVGSGKRTELNKYLIAIKKQYPTAYIKNSDVYVGCMH